MGCFKKRETDIAGWTYKAWRYRITPETPEEAEIAEKIAVISLCQHFPGWTLEYAASLDHFQRADIFGKLAGDTKVQEAQARDARKKH